MDKRTKAFEGQDCSEESFWRGLRLWKFRVQSTYQTWGGFSQATVTQVRPLERPPNCLSAIYRAVYEKDHSNKYSIPTGRRKYFLLRYRTVSFNVTICRDNLHAQSALPRTMSEPMIPNSNMAALPKNLALIFATLPPLRPML